MGWLDRLSAWWNSDQQTYIGRGLIGDIDTSINPSGPSQTGAFYQTAGDRFRAEARQLDDPLQSWMGGMMPRGPGAYGPAYETDTPITPGFQEGYGPAFETDEQLGPTSPITANDISADDRLKQRVMQQTENNLTPSPDEIRQAANTAVADFQTERAMLEAQRQMALDQGLTDVANDFDRRIRDQERAIGKLQDEIALTGDIEGWYRNRIAGPYQQAREAAEMVDLTNIMAVQQEAREEQARMLADMEGRLEGVLGDLGFTPEQMEAMRGERAADNEVTAAQNALLEASGVRQGELDWEKKLRLSMVEEEWLRSGRESTGREMVTAARNREAISDINYAIDNLRDMKSEAMDRVRRAVDREFQGAEFPEREEFIAAAMESMSMDLIGDLPPDTQQWFRDAASYFINSGTPMTVQNLVDAVLNGDIVTSASQEIDDIWSRKQQEIKIATQAGDADLVRQLEEEMVAEMRAAAEDSFDMEDRAILRGLVGTYNDANSQYDTYMEQRQSRNYTNADNRNPDNIADAQAGRGVYGARAQMTASMVPVIDQMWGDQITKIEGANYFRPMQSEEETRAAGRAMNSDHLTAGALDLYLDANNPEDMAFYNNVMVPQLRRWQEQGLVASWVGLGANAAHDNHVHVSFALPGMNDQGFNPQDPHQHDDQTNQDLQGNVDQGTLSTLFQGGM